MVTTTTGLTTVTWPDAAEIVFSYDSYGRRTTVTDPDGNVTAYSYANTSMNKGLSTVEHSVPGSQGLGTITVNRDARGRLSSLTGPYGLAQEWSYDGYSRNTGFTVSSYLTGGASSPVHTESYTDDPNRV